MTRDPFASREPMAMSQPPEATASTSVGSASRSVDRSTSI